MDIDSDNSLGTGAIHLRIWLTEYKIDMLLNNFLKKTNFECVDRAYFMFLDAVNLNLEKLSKFVI